MPSPLRSNARPPRGATNPRSSSLPFRTDVEGLRAVAVGLVVANHAGLLNLSGGFVGVDVFFVLSGFLITSILLRRAEADEIDTRWAGQLAWFYARRARRILPAATVTLVCTLMAAYYFLGFLRGDDVARDAYWCAVFVGNIHFGDLGTNYFSAQQPPSPLQHFWSLGVEEQFYFVWPSVVLVAMALGQRRLFRLRLNVFLVVVIGCSLAWSVRETRIDPAWAYFSPFTRAWELGVGALVATTAPFLTRTISTRMRVALSWVGLLGILASGWAIGASTAFPGWVATAPVIATAAVVVGGLGGGATGAGKILGLAPLQWLGRLSYSFYLWHWPVLVIAEERTRQPLGVFERVALVFLGLLLAACSYYVVERPVRRSSFLAKHSLVTIALGAGLVIGVLWVADWTLARNAGLL